MCASDFEEAVMENFCVGVFVLAMLESVLTQHSDVYKEPTFQTEWFTMEAQNVSFSPLTVQHGLGEAPQIVEVYTKDDHGISVATPGGAWWDDDLNKTYCGLTYTYNDKVIKLYAPYSRNQGAIAAITCYGGVTWGNTVQEVYLVAEVKVLAWKSEDLPLVDFDSGWIGMGVTGNGFLEVPNTLGMDSKALLIVRGYSSTYNQTGPWYGRAIGSVQDKYDLRQRGSVVYGKSESKFRVWRGMINLTDPSKAEKGPPCLICILDGWCDSSRNGINVTSGEVRIVAWKHLSKMFSWSRAFNSSDSITDLPTGINMETSLGKLIVDVDIEAIDGPNLGFVFPGLGFSPTLVADSKEAKPYSGVVFSIQKVGITIYFPTGPNGHAISIRDPWAFGMNEQSSNKGIVHVTIRSWEPVSNLETRQCHFKKIGTTGGETSSVRMRCAAECCTNQFCTCIRMSSSPRCEFVEKISGEANGTTYCKD